MEHINLEFFFKLEREGKKSIIDFCTEMGFIASSYECPECKKPMKLVYNKDRNQDGFVWCCRHKNRVKRSIRNGTWFQGSRLSLIMMLKLAYLWVKRTTFTWIFHELKMATGTVCDYMAFFRKVCVNAIQNEGIFIGGPNEIVEIDAKSFSNVKNKQGHETWVFGGVERSSKKCFLEIMQSGEENEITSILQKYVLPGTTIISDNWKGFDCLESNGYVHQKLGKTGFKDSVTGLHKNNILSLWGRLKKLVCQRIANDQFDSYLAEIMWRRLHQENIQGQLMSFFKILSHIFPPQVRDDPTYISRKIEMENEKKKDSIKTQLMEVNGNNNVKQGEVEIPPFSEDSSSEESIPDLEFSENDFIGETRLEEVDGDNNEGETESGEVNGDNYEGENVSVNLSEYVSVNLSENESMEEIEVPVMYSKNSSSEDEFESENGRQNKRQKTMESLDT